MSDMDVQCRVTTPGGWLDLMSGPYQLSAEAFLDEQVQWRRQEVASPFVEGTWLVNAVRDNATTQIVIWVRGTSSAEVVAAVQALKDTFSQINYGVEFTVNGAKQFFQCYAADYSVQTSREFRASRMAKFTAEITYHPVVEADVS